MNIGFLYMMLTTQIFGVIFIMNGHYCLLVTVKPSICDSSQKSSLLRSLILGTKPKHYSQENSLRKKAMKFWRMHSWVIHKARWVLLVALTAIAGVGMYTMAQLKGSNSVPALFPDGHNIQVRECYILFPTPCLFIFRSYPANADCVC